MITKGTPKILKTANKTTVSSKKKICSLYLAKLKFFIFKEKSGNSAFRIYALSTEIPNNTQTLVNAVTANSKSAACTTSGKLKIKSALAGVGNPIKESVCRVSILNLAKRIHEPKVMINPK